jgi:hypothetical protein
MLVPSIPYSHGSNVTSPLTAGLPPNTPSSATPTPISRTLPFLRDLSLQSPATRRMRYQNMPTNHQMEERDDLGPLSPDAKRRRFNGDNHQPTIQRVIPPRYGTVPAGKLVGPGTPFPFGQVAHPYPQMYTPAHGAGIPQSRRESLPGLRGVVSPSGPMAPPPRPGMGYQQHRMSQGHIGPDRSLQLPPLQTGAATIGAPPPSAKSAVNQSVDEVIMSMPFEAKLAILRKIAPPKALEKNSPRGPLIAIEGDNPEAVFKLAKWLSEILGKDSELNVKLLETPDVAPKGSKDDAMAEYHILVAHWLGKSKAIMRDLEYDPNGAREAAKSTKSDHPASATRNVEDNYNDEDDEITPTRPSSSDNITHKQIDSAHPIATSSPQSQPTTLKTDLSSVVGLDANPFPRTKPTSIIPLFSLHASNTFACRIPLLDTYAPNDHWSWNATQWRGVVGADLTIYLKDGEGKGMVEQKSEEERLIVVRRVGESGQVGVDGATARRVGFEVGEWVRGFGE